MCRVREEVIPTRKSIVTLAPEIVFYEQFERKAGIQEKIKKEASPRDKTLWLASHHASLIIWHIGHFFHTEIFHNRESGCC